MRVQLDVFGERTDAEFSTECWTSCRIGSDGKSSDSGPLIPSFMAAQELQQFLFDLLHEGARPTKAAIRHLPDA